MDFLEFAKTRASVRKYTVEKIDEASIARVMDAGRIAPTAAYILPLRFMVVDSDNGLARSIATRASAPRLPTLCIATGIEYRTVA